MSYVSAVGVQSGSAFGDNSLAAMVRPRESDFCDVDLCIRCWW